MVKQAWHLESCIWTTSVFEGLLRSLWLVHLFASLSTLQPRKADREKKERGKKKAASRQPLFPETKWQETTVSWPTPAFRWRAFWKHPRGSPSCTSQASHRGVEQQPCPSVAVPSGTPTQAPTTEQSPVHLAACEVLCSDANSTGH